MQVVIPHILLRPLTLSDKEKFYQWATNSDGATNWYGALYGDKIPTRMEFFEDYDEDYFDEGKRCEKGVFAMKLVPEEREIGAVNYQVEQVDSEQYYDIDILIASDQDKNKGYGSTALSSLVKMLSLEYNAINFIIHVHAQNIRAQRAYEKAGFNVNRSYEFNGVEWIEYRLNHYNYGV